MENLVKKVVFPDSFSAGVCAEKYGKTFTQESNDTADLENRNPNYYVLLTEKEYLDWIS